MREIKVKAWSPSRKCWIADWSISEYTETLDLTSKQVKYDEDSIIVQFTGLLDKNGKEIWEGDVLSSITMYEIGRTGGIERNFIAFWDEYKWRLKCAHVIPGHSAYTVSIIQNHEELEIIGNIYENPELIKTNKGD